MRGNNGLDVIGTEDGQRVLDMANDDGAKEHRVYHGSGADFDHFDHSHMGEGKGAQAYGWGTYVTEVEGIGRTYAVQNAKLYGAYIDAEHEYEKAKIIYNGLVRNIAGLKSNLSVYERSLGKTKKLIAEHGDDQQFVDKQTDRIKRTEASIAATKAEIKAAMGRLPESEKRMKSAKERLDALPAPERHLYTIEIPDDNGRNYLDWNGHPTESLLKDVGSFGE